MIHQRISGKKPVKHRGRSRLTTISKRTANTVIFLLFGMQAYAVVTFTELFPFGPHPMFAYAQKKLSAAVLMAYGVTADGTEISFMTDPKYDYPPAGGAPPWTFPQDGRHLQWNLERFEQSSNMKENLDKVLKELFARYERNMRHGMFEGPPLVGVRLYREISELRYDASNRNQPDRRELVTEFKP